jgi:hypothetical protein
MRSLKFTKVPSKQEQLNTGHILYYKENVHMLMHYYKKIYEYMRLEGKDSQIF